MKLLKSNNSQNNQLFTTLLHLQVCLWMRAPTQELGRIQVRKLECYQAWCKKNEKIWVQIGGENLEHSWNRLSCWEFCFCVLALKYFSLKVQLHAATMMITGPTGRGVRATRSSPSSSSTWTRPRSARWYLITIKCDANICCWFKIEFPFPGWGIHWRNEEMRYCWCWCTTGNWAFGNVTIYLWGEIYLTGCIWILTKMTKSYWSFELSNIRLNPIFLMENISVFLTSSQGGLFWPILLKQIGIPNSWNKII